MMENKWGNTGAQLAGKSWLCVVFRWATWWPPYPWWGESPAPGDGSLGLRRGGAVDSQNSGCGEGRGGGHRRGGAGLTTLANGAKLSCHSAVISVLFYPNRNIDPSVFLWWRMQYISRLFCFRPVISHQENFLLQQRYHLRQIQNNCDKL